MSDSSITIESDMTVEQSMQTETESHVDHTGTVFMILWLIALIMIGMIIFSYVRAKYRRYAVGSSATKGGKAATTTRVEHDDEEFPVELKAENIAEQQQEQHLNAEVQHRQPLVDRMPTGLLPVLAILIALSLSVATQTSCEYISSSGIRLIRYNDNKEVEVWSFGLWSAAIYDGSYGSANRCQSIFLNGFPIDGKIIFARVAAMLASFLGSIALITSLCYVSLGRLESPGFRRISWGLSLATFAQALVVVLVSTDLCYSGDVCELDIGAASSFTATVYWFVAALSIIFIQVPRVTAN